MEKELFSMKIKERRTVDGAFNSRKSNKNRRKSDLEEDHKLHHLMESVYMLKGIIFTDSFKNITENTTKHDYLDIEYSVLETSENNYIVQEGTFVVVLNSIFCCENVSSDNITLEDILPSIEDPKVELFLYNGSWWANQDKHFQDVEYKMIREEKSFMEDLKEIMKDD